MQLTLNQADIEAGIKAHVAQMVDVKDGMEINIELKATRGDGGYSAIVDISPAGEYQKAEKAPKVVTPRKPRVVASTASTAPEKAAEQQVQTQPDEPQQAAVDTVDESAQAAVVEPDPEPVAAAEPAPAATPAKSLFAGLKKPVNA